MATSSANSHSTTQPSNVQSILKRNSKDVGWDYGVLVDGKNMDKVQCSKCGKIVSGGIHRLKEYIAHVSGNVAPCSKSSKEDQLICRNALNEAKLKRKKKKDDCEQLRSTVNINKGSTEEDIYKDQLQESLGTTKSPRTLGPLDKFTSVINPESSLGSGGSRLREQNINDVLFKQRTEVVKDYVGRWLYEGGIPFNSVELDSFKLMVEAIGQFGPGFLPPTRYELTVPILKKEVSRTTEMLKKHKEEWQTHGYSIMTDAWSDRKRRSIMNLCANSRLGTVFLSSKDYSDVAHTSEVIFEFVDKCIEEIGPDNVVQVVTDNASNNMGAKQLLKEKRPKIFWTSCAEHTINLMLEAVAKQPRFKKYIDEAKELRIFIYAHHKVLAMMRAHTNTRDIVRPVVTRFASSFLTLQSLNDKKSELKMMFGSSEWDKSRFSKSVKGEIAYSTVMSNAFWSGVALCLQVFTPLIKVLRIADSDRKPSMGFVYGELLQAKEDIKDALNNVPRTYEPIIEVIDEKMKDKLDSPLHLSAYGLNPYYHYKNHLHLSYKDVLLGMMGCMDILFPGDDDMQNKIMLDELSIYKDKNATFGKSNAVKTCSSNDAKFDPVQWWSIFGVVTPNLQRLAVRILSLTSSSFGCEINWSAFEVVHSKKRNRLNASLLNNLVFVQFNARLLNKQISEKNCDKDVLLSNEATKTQEWIVDGIDDDDEHIDDDGEDEFRPRKYRSIRELYDEFESGDERGNGIEENELDGGRISRYVAECYED